MSHAATKTHAGVYEADYEGEHASGWAGWIGFGGFMMILAGMLNVINGLVGLYQSSFYLITDKSNQLVVFSNVRTWAWVTLISGAIVMLAGFSLFSGTTWSRIVAVFFAMAAIAVNVLSIALYPIWSILAISFAVLVIYAVIVHGNELRYDE
jgi:hypothetical protein